MTLALMGQEDKEARSEPHWHKDDRCSINGIVAIKDGGGGNDVLESVGIYRERRAERPHTRRLLFLTSQLESKLKPHLKSETKEKAPRTHIQDTITSYKQQETSTMKLTNILIASIPLTTAAAGTIRPFRTVTTPKPVAVRDTTTVLPDRSKVESGWNEHKVKPV